MNLKRILLSVAILSLPAYGFAQCDFKSEKKEPDYSFIKTSVGPTMLQWKFWIGKNTSNDPYLWVHVVESGNHKYTMTGTDKITFEFEDGEKMAFSPDGDAKGKVYFDGSLVTSTYPVRLKVDRKMIEKLSKVNLKQVHAAIEDRKAERDVKERTVEDIKAAASCVLN